MFSKKKTRDIQKEKKYYCVFTDMISCLDLMKKVKSGKADVEDLIYELGELEYIHRKFMSEEIKKLLS